MPVDTRFQGVEYFESTFSQQIGENGKVNDLKKWMFDDKFGDGEGEWPIEAGRYRIVWMPACPHAHKVIITRRLLGLDEAISLATTGVFRSPKGWVFSEDEGEKDPVLGVYYLHDIYTRKEPDYTGRSTVPIIVDTITGQGVNNHHFYIPQILNTDWKKYHKKNAPMLYPEDIRSEIDELNKYVYIRVNKGFYDCGFARSQEIYDDGYNRLFEALDFLDDRLKDRRFLHGDYITDTDIRLYPSLVRFYAAYHQVYKVNRQRLEDFKYLWPYARDLYQTPGFGDTTYFDFYRKSYMCSPHLKPLWGNIHGIYAKGPADSKWLEPTDRANLSGIECKFRFEG